MAPARSLLAIALFWSALVTTRAVAPEANCDLLYQGTPVSDSSWQAWYNASANVGPLKDDTEPGTVYLELTTKEVADFTFTNPVSPYINVELSTESSTLRLVVLEAFSNYEEEQKSATDASIIIVYVQLSCTDGNSANFEFRITVQDVNNHAPEFEMASYEYELPMPLPSDINLACLVDEIKVTDIDFSNTGITIEFDETGTELFDTQVTALQNRQYAVQLFSKTSIELKETTKFTMRAKDSGNPQQTSADIPLTIKVNQETSPPAAPRFGTAALHKTVRAEDIEVGKDIASVEIDEGYDQDVVVTYTTVEETGLTAPQTAFAHETTPGEGGKATVTLRWAEGVTRDAVQDFKYALIVLEATRDRGVSTKQVAHTVIHLSLPGMQDPPAPTTTPAEPTTCPPCETCTTEPPVITTPCPPCPETTTPAEPTTCPPCQTCTTEPPMITTPCPETTTSAEPTTCPPCQTCTTEPPVITTPCPETTTSGSPTDCSQCPPTECPQCPPTECPQCPPTECPATPPSTDSSTGTCECSSSSPTPPHTDCPIDCSECPPTPPTSSSSESSSSSSEGTTNSPTTPDTGSSSSSSTGSSTGSNDCPTTCAPCEPCPTTVPTSTTTALPPGPAIEFENARYPTTEGPFFTGQLLDLTLKPYDSEGYSLVCQLDATDYVAARVGVKATSATVCQLTVDVFLDPGSYDFQVVASLAGTSSTATATVAFGVTAAMACNSTTPAYFPYSLLVVDPLLEFPTGRVNILPAMKLATQCHIESDVDPAEYQEWVDVNTATGAVDVVELDYEKVTSLIISLHVVCEADQQQQTRASSGLHRKDQPDWPRSLTSNQVYMAILLQIEDDNDNPPVFTVGDGGRLVVGYPTGDLLQRVQPGPVVTLTATDADEGVNAELRYRLDTTGSQLLMVQEETGAIYLRADAPDMADAGVKFTATVVDRAGATGALDDTLTVEVKPLKREELVLVTTVEGALPEDAPSVVANLSAATGLLVGLLRAYPSKSESSRMFSDSERALGLRADSQAALTLLLYALDDNEALVTVDQFQALLSSSASDLKVSKLPLEVEGQEPVDVTGYMAGIITLAVLVALAIVGAGASYYFYFRPRMGPVNKKNGYTEFTSDEVKPSPLESQIPQITTTVEPNISTVNEIIEPVNQLPVENNIQTHGDSIEVLAPSSEDDWSRKRSVTIRGGPDDYNDVEAPGESRKSESSDSVDGDEDHAESERRKSTVHFNENVECIEVDRL